MTTAKTGSPERFTAAWDQFVLALRRAQARGQLGPDELTLAQYYVLASLTGGRPLQISQLAELAGVSAPTATRLVDGLERAGLVRRRRSEEDRRTVLVSITSAGRTQYRRRQRQIAERRRQLYERLDPAERAQSERLLRHLAELIGEL
jgi:MarR family transcriptional regulator, organic hydroperoxide resistance regulator